MPAAALGRLTPALARLDSLAPRGMKLGLAAVDAVCERLDRPEREVPSVLIAGTNGKGSVAATLSAIAAAAGLRAGLYTSPHLERVSERIRIEERDVTDEELDEVLARVFRSSDSAPEIPLTYFEALTAAAFVAFARRGLDLAILEVGLGGRFDATNVAPARMSIVTSIALDHTEELGPTVEAIAREKAGIFRAGRPALVGGRDDPALRELAAAAEEAGAELHDARREIEVSGIETSIEGTRFDLATPEGSLRLATPLPGRHQAGNAALAARAAELLSREIPGIGPDAVGRGVSATRWPGRLERLGARGQVVLLDGCHNPEAAGALARFLEDAGLAGRARLVFGAMADKDVEAMAARLFPSVVSVHLVPAPSARAATVSELLARTRASRPDAPGHAAGTGPAEPQFISLEEALRDLLGATDPGNLAPIIVAGSLYLVGEARSLLLSGRLEDE